MTLAAGTKLGRYEIRAKIGEGGMGEVYLAHDTKLDRSVALKILPPDVARDRSRMNRFVQEAKAASALNHPNIITIHEIDATDAGHFIATEYVDGKTLREHLRNPVPVSEVLDIAVQIASALNAAHQAGIVHRDIKPENVMVRVDGLVKVLDFGLAKLTGRIGNSDPEAATQIQSDTQPGMIMGTVAYMSPEQARGQAVDQRSDVWSLGVVLYEMLTRRQPFRGDTAADTMTNILHREPDALNIGALPDDLAIIVEKMLAKNLEARYPTMVHAVSALKSLHRRIEFDTELQQTILRNSAEARTAVNASPTASKAVSETASASISTSSKVFNKTRTGEGFWVAVLPFKFRDTDPEIAVLADGLSEEIVTGLSRFRYLSVVTSTSAVRLKGETSSGLDSDFGTRYVLEGSIRKGGSAIRVTAQLVDTETGAQLWCETYNRDLQTSAFFAVQDDVAGRIVATVADSYGVLVHSMRAAIQKKDDSDLTPVEWQFQYFAYREQITPASHAELKTRLQRVAERNEGQSDLWACLAQIYVDEYAFGFQNDATSLDRALAAGRRAVELDRANQFALVALAQVHFFRQDLAAFGPAAERAMALNPLNTDAIGILGLQIVHTGQFDRGTAIVRRAMELNPNHAGWMHFAPLWNHFHKGEYEQALECANSVDVPGLFWPYLVMASACGHLGRYTEAEAAVKDLLALDPEFAAHVRSHVASWHFASGLLEPLLEGLRKAGLKIRDEESASLSSASRLASVETRADEGFWVAVLPFKATGTGAELATLAEGLSDEIVTGLSRFSYLRVISRSSTLRYATETSDIRAVGQTLGARYVMEGNLRQAGTRMRLAVQLVDTTTGAHLWAETYNRPFQNEDIFSVQDELVPCIVSTVADWYGVLPHNMGEAVQLKPPDQLSPYESVLRSFAYYERVTPEGHAAVRAALQRAVEQAPGNADCWAMLSVMYGDEHRFGFNVEPDALGRSLKAAQRAVDSASFNHYAYLALAQALFFRKEMSAFRGAAERAIALNPMDGAVVEYMGHLIAFSGDWELGCELAERARLLNPNHPGWYWSVQFHNAYRQGDYAGAQAITQKVTSGMGEFIWHVMLAALYGQLGNRELANKAVRELLTLQPRFAAVARHELEKWYPPDLVEQLIDGFRKAGMEIDDISHASVAPRDSQPSPPSIAVMPLANMSNDPDNEYFCDGLAEELLNALAKIDELKVAARTSTFSFKGKNAAVSEIANTLKVNTVLEGSVRKSGNRLRITAQLINASDGYHLWSERYDRELKDIFDVQDEITLAVIDALKVKLLGKEKSAVLKRHTRNPEAHEFYLRGLSYFIKFTPEFFQKAIESFEQAIAIDPNYASAYAALAESYTEMSFFSSPDWMPKARAAASKALELDDTLGSAHNSLAVIKMYYDRDFAGAENEFTRAIALDPGSAHIHMWYAWYLGLMGRFDEALKKEGFAQELDPLSDLTAFGIGAIFYWSRQPERAIGHFRRRLELSPNLRIAYWFLADAYVAKGDFASAIDTIENAPVGLRDHVMLSASGYVYARAGDRQNALKILSGLEKQSSQESNVAFNIAQIYLGLGEHAQALDWLEKAEDERSVWLIWLGVDPKFDPLRDHPRFKNLLGRVGFAQ